MRCANLPRYDGGMNFRLPLMLAFTLLVSAAWGAEPVFPPGSRVGLVPPPGMTASAPSQGFEDRARGAILVVTELSAQSYAKVLQDFAPEQMRAGGMEPVARETIALSAGEGLLVVARQSENGVAMRKWALLALADDMTAIVIATLPEAARDAYPDAALRAALASVVVRDRLSPDEMLAVLPYRLADLGGFRLLRANPDGTAVLTLGPNDTTLPAEQPYFMVAPRAVEPPQLAERERFSQRALMAFVNRPNLRIARSEAVRIGNAQGHEIIAESRDQVSGDDLVLVQWLRFGTGGVVQMFGIARRDQWDTALPRMRALRDGFQVR
jgi:hypothetical protein